MNCEADWADGHNASLSNHRPSKVGDRETRIGVDQLDLSSVQHSTGSSQVGKTALDWPQDQEGDCLVDVRINLTINHNGCITLTKSTLRPELIVDLDSVTDECQHVNCPNICINSPRYL